MATLATMYNRILGVRDYTDAPARSENADDTYAIRALPNEDVYFFVKDINNARVVRQDDPGERSAAWKMLASGGAVAALLIAVLLPSAYSLLAGYKVEALKTEQTVLLREKAKLEIEEAALLSQERLEELAKIQSFVDPAPQKLVYLDGKSGSLAMNVKK